MNHGQTAERAVRKHLEQQGWVVFPVTGTRLPGGRRGFHTAGTTVCDLIALRRLSGRLDHDCPDDLASDGPLLVEVKATTRSPWVAFSKAERRELLETAQRAGAEAWLAWYPPGGDLRYLPSDEWPPL